MMPPGYHVEIVRDTHFFCHRCHTKTPTLTARHLFLVYTRSKDITVRVEIEASDDALKVQTLREYISMAEREADRLEAIIRDPLRRPPAVPKKEKVPA